MKRLYLRNCFYFLVDTRVDYLLAQWLVNITTTSASFAYVTSLDPFCALRNCICCSMSIEISKAIVFSNVIRNLQFSYVVYDTSCVRVCWKQRSLETAAAEKTAKFMRFDSIQ